MCHAVLAIDLYSIPMQYLPQGTNKAGAAVRTSPSPMTTPTPSGRAEALDSNAAALLGGLVACSNKYNDDGCFAPRRKRARVGRVAGGAGAGLAMEGHGSLLKPLPVQQQAFAPAGDVQQSCRLLCSVGVTRPSSAAPVSPSSHGLLSLLYLHSVEIDTLVRIETERLRSGLEAARRRHAKAVVSALDRAGARRLRGAEAELERALARNAELEERLRQTSAEGQAWQGVARSHEAVAAGLRATLDKVLLQSQRDGGDAAEDAQSCCFEQRGEEGASARTGSRACKSCGGEDACVLLLPCRHLCLCARCEADADACPVCLATKNASLHVLLA